MSDNHEKSIISMWHSNLIEREHFLRTEKYIQQDCIIQPSQTELSKCHDREKRSFTQLKPENTTLSRMIDKITVSIFQNENLNFKKVFPKDKFIQSRPNKAGIIRISYKTAFIRSLLSVEKFYTAVWNLWLWGPPTINKTSEFQRTSHWMTSCTSMNFCVLIVSPYTCRDLKKKYYNLFITLKDSCSMAAVSLASAIDETKL